MKKQLFLLIILFSLSKSNAQVKIGAAGNPDVNAVLELAGSSKGLLLPRLALTGTANASPLSAHTAGMVIYNTATTGDVTPGYYYDDGVHWSRVAYSSETWALSGNAATNPAVQYLGTSDPVDFAIRTNNFERIRISSAGFFDIGTNALPVNIRIKLGGIASGGNSGILGVNGTINASADGQVLYSIYNSPNFGTAFNPSNVIGTNTNLIYAGKASALLAGESSLLQTTGSNSYPQYVNGIRGTVFRSSTGADGGVYAGFFDVNSPGSGSIADLYGVSSNATISGSNPVSVSEFGAQQNVVQISNGNALINGAFGIKNTFTHNAASTISIAYGLYNNITASSSATISNAVGSFLSFSASSGSITNGYGYYVNPITSTADISNFRGVYVGNIALTSGTRRAFEYAGTGTNDPVVINYDGTVQIGTNVPVTNAKLTIVDGHLQCGQTTKPTIVASSNMGTGASASLNDATDIAGTINLIFGSGAWGSGPQATITFNKPYANPPIVIITAANQSASSAIGNNQVFVSKTANNFSLFLGVAVAGATLMSFDYYIIETVNN